MSTVSKSPRVLVFVAHPDDESYGAELLRRAGQQDASVELLYLTHGEGGRLLQKNERGQTIERRDFSPRHVATVRNREVRAASRLLTANGRFLYPANLELDFGYTTSTKVTEDEWNRRAPGGIEGITRKVAAQICRFKPTWVVTTDAQGDPHAFGQDSHGHHRQVGIIAEQAIDLAARKSFAGSRAHTIDEWLTFCPAGLEADLEVKADPAWRKRYLSAYPSQFAADTFDPLADRRFEGFMIQGGA